MLASSPVTSENPATRASVSSPPRPEAVRCTSKLNSASVGSGMALLHQAPAVHQLHELEHDKLRGYRGGDTHLDEQPAFRSLAAHEEGFLRRRAREGAGGEQPAEPALHGARDTAPQD